jgi:hypothetical protein
MAQARRGARSEATRLADLVRKAVDEGATTAEEIHKTIADLPLEVLQRIDVFKDTVQDARRIQDASIGAVYDVIRKVNRRVTSLAGDLLERSAKLRTASRKKPAAIRKKAPSTATA